MGKETIKEEVRWKDNAIAATVGGFILFVICFFLILSYDSQLQECQNESNRLYSLIADGSSIIYREPLERQEVQQQPIRECIEWEYVYAFKTGNPYCPRRDRYHFLETNENACCRCWSDENCAKKIEQPVRECVEFGESEWIFDKECYERESAESVWAAAKCIIKTPRTCLCWSDEDCVKEPQEIDDPLQGTDYKCVSRGLPQTCIKWVKK